MRKAVNIVLLMILALGPAALPIVVQAENGMPTDEYFKAIEERRRAEEARRREMVKQAADTMEKKATDQSGDGLNANIDMTAPSSNGSAMASSGSNASAGMIAQTVGSGLQSTGSSMISSCCGNPGGGSCCARGQMMVGMGMLSLLQSLMNSGASGQHGYVGDVTYSGGGKNRNPSSDSAGNGSEGSGAFSGAINKLNSQGIKYDGKSKTLQFPDGKKLNLADVTSQSAMAGLGLSKEDFAKNMDYAKSLEAKANAEVVDKIGAHTETHGFSGASSSASTGVSAEEGSSYGQGAGAKVDPKPTVAGMMKSYNGELIGVSGDSLFEMMNRRYQQKSKEEAFLRPEDSPSK